MNDADDATVQCAENASTLRADPTKGFLLGGTSAGANLSVVAAHEAVDANLSPPVTGVVVTSACVCHHDAVPEEYKKHISSWEEHKDGLVLDRRGMKWFYGTSVNLYDVTTSLMCRKITTSPILIRRWPVHCFGRRIRISHRHIYRSWGKR